MIRIGSRWSLAGNQTQVTVTRRPLLQYRNGHVPLLRDQS